MLGQVTVNRMSLPGLKPKSSISSNTYHWLCHLSSGPPFSWPSPVCGRGSYLCGWFDFLWWKRIGSTLVFVGPRARVQLDAYLPHFWIFEFMNQAYKLSIKISFKPLAVTNTLYNDDSEKYVQCYTIFMTETPQNFQVN